MIYSQWKASRPAMIMRSFLRQSARFARVVLSSIVCSKLMPHVRSCRARDAFLQPNAEVFYLPSAKAEMILQVASELALDGRTLEIPGPAMLFDSGSLAELIVAIERGLPGRDRRQN